MIEIKPPTSFVDETSKENIFAIFLAGSIEMGKAINWQDKVVEALKDEKDLVVLDVPGSPEMKIKKLWNTPDGVEGYWCQWFTTTFEYREKWFPASIMRKL